MKHASRFEGLLFDPFSLFQDGYAPTEVNVGRGKALQALLVSAVVVVIGEGVDLLP